jgi:hypothetical protein
MKTNLVNTCDYLVIGGLISFIVLSGYIFNQFTSIISIL